MVLAFSKLSNVNTILAILLFISLNLLYFVYYEGADKSTVDGTVLDNDGNGSDQFGFYVKYDSGRYSKGKTASYLPDNQESAHVPSDTVSPVYLIQVSYSTSHIWTKP